MTPDRPPISVCQPAARRRARVEAPHRRARALERDRACRLDGGRHAGRPGRLGSDRGDAARHRPADAAGRERTDAELHHDEVDRHTGGGEGSAASANSVP